MGFSLSSILWLRTAPRPYGEASAATINSFVGSKCTMMAEDCNICFSFSNAWSAHRTIANGRSFLITCGGEREY